MSSADDLSAGAHGAAQKRQHIADAGAYVSHRHALLKPHRLHHVARLLRLVAVGAAQAGCHGFPALFPSGTGNSPCVATWADMAPASASASAAKTSILFMCFMISAAGLEEGIADLNAAYGAAMLQILGEEDAAICRQRGTHDQRIVICWCPERSPRDAPHRAFISSRVYGPAALTCERRRINCSYSAAAVDLPAYRLEPIRGKRHSGVFFSTPRPQAGPVDQLLVGAEGDIPHDLSVHESRVALAVLPPAGCSPDTHTPPAARPPPLHPERGLS